MKGRNNLVEMRTGPLEDVKLYITKNDEYVTDNVCDILLNDDMGKSRLNSKIFSVDERELICLEM